MNFQHAGSILLARNIIFVFDTCIYTVSFFFKEFVNIDEHCAPGHYC